MKRNVGGWDRVIRLIVGLGILVIGYAYNSYWGLIGLVPLLTALTRWCPLYIPLKISTCKTGSCGSGSGCCCSKKK